MDTKSNSEINFWFLQNSLHNFSEYRTEVIKSIYNSCSIGNNDVCVSKIINFISPFMKEHSSELQALNQVLDPDNVDPTISFEDFEKNFIMWSSNLYTSSKSTKSSNSDLACADNYDGDASKNTPDIEKDIETDVSTLHDQLRSVTLENYGLINNLDSLKVQLDKCETENALLAKTNSQLRNQCKRGAKSCHQQNIDNSICEENIRDCDVLNKKLLNLKHLLSVTREDNHELVKKVEEYENRNITLQKDTQHLQKTVQIKEDLIKDLNTALRENEKQIMELKNANKDLIIKLGQQREIAFNLTNQNTDLKTQLEQQSLESSLQELSFNDTHSFSDSSSTGTHSNPIPSSNNLDLTSKTIHLHHANSSTPSKNEIGTSSHIDKTNVKKKPNILSYCRFMDEWSGVTDNPPLRLPKNELTLSNRHSNNANLLKPAENECSSAHNYSQSSQKSCYDDTIDDPPQPTASNNYPMNNNVTGDVLQVHQDLSLTDCQHMMHQQKMNIEELQTKISTQERTIMQLTEDLSQFCALNSKLIKMEQEEKELNLKIFNLETDNNLKYIRIVDLMEQNENLMKYKSEHEQEITHMKRKDLVTDSDPLTYINVADKDSKTKLNLVSQDKQILDNDVQKERCASLTLDPNLKGALINEHLDINDGNDYTSVSINYENILDNLSQKENQVKILETMINYQNNSLNLLENEKQSYIDQIENLKFKFDELSKINRELLTEQKTARNKADTLAKEIETFKNDNKNLQTVLKEVQNKLDSYGISCVPVEEYESLIIQKKSECGQLVDENKTIKNKYEKLKDQLQLLVRQLDEFRPNGQELKLQLDKIVEDVVKLKKKFHIQKLKINISECSKTELKKKIDELENANKSLQATYESLLSEHKSMKTNHNNLIREKENWYSETSRLRITNDNLVDSLSDALLNNQQLKMQLDKRSKAICTLCVKLGKENEELKVVVQTLRSEISCLEKELSVVTNDHIEQQKLKKNLEISVQSLRDEMEIYKTCKQENVQLLLELNEVKANRTEEKLTSEKDYMDSINKLQAEKDVLEETKGVLQKAKDDVDKKYANLMECFQTQNKDIENTVLELNNENSALKNSQAVLEEKYLHSVQMSKKHIMDLNDNITELYKENMSLREKLEKALCELSQKTDMVVQLQTELQEENVYLELFHQKSVLFQQTIESVCSQKSALEQQLNKAINDLRQKSALEQQLNKAINDLHKSEQKYMSIRKSLIDAQSVNVSGDSHEITHPNQKDLKLEKLMMSLKTCEDELSQVRMKFSEPFYSTGSLTEQLNNVCLIVSDCREKLNSSMLTWIASWQEMLKDIMNVQIIFDKLASNDVKITGHIDIDILKLQKEIYFITQFLHSLSNFKFSFVTNKSAEHSMIPLHRMLPSNP